MRAQYPLPHGPYWGSRGGFGCVGAWVSLGGGVGGLAQNDPPPPTVTKQRSGEDGGWVVGPTKYCLRLSV